MARPVFVDTSAWLAAVDSSDRSHRLVNQWMETNLGQRLVTTSFVLDETLTLLRRRLGHVSAKQFGQALFESKAAQLVYITQEDVIHAWKIFYDIEDQDCSFTDCTSFAVMKRLKLTEALAMDRHFSIMGFTLVI